ncbi:uncharacterized protein LOC142544162 [Primulina tabacum]|uniref:uncharacterized protein LOC142544162 n=1 Tax=Primulina tabacum TaxID=48773 RepID=UPI003F59F5ED
MVQRKVPNKLCIQDNNIKSEIRLANLEPSSLQYQDVKNKGVDLKKKMKKSGSIKFENHRSPKLPNYMKSTSSSVARKEQLQVSTRSTPASLVSSDLHGKNLNRPSKLSADSINKAAKTSIRTTGLKIKRTLIKTPSFKPGRALVKKCPKVVICEDFDIARATCSSTLKDYKLPDYLVLNQGGTESEGTSVIKVCPYTYCSLNGHLHDPLPPLKSFMSAKRLMLKNQRKRAVGMPVSTASEACRRCAEEKKTSNTDFVPMVHGGDEIIAPDYEEVEETILGGGDINFHETLDEDRNETDSIDMYLESMSSIQQYEPDSESSDTDWETGRYSALYLDFDYVSPSKEEKGDGLDGFQDENGMIHDGFIKEPRDCIISFFDANDMSQDTYSEDSLNSDSASSKDDCRSEQQLSSQRKSQKQFMEIRTCLLKGNKTPERIAQLGDTEAPSDLMIEEEASFGCLNFECLPNEDAVGEADLLKDVVQEMVTSGDKAISDIIIDVDVHHRYQMKEDSSESSTKPDQVATQNKVGRGISKNNLLLQDQFIGEGIAIAIAKCKRFMEESDEEGQFNPREPNFLPLEPEPEAEKVDLRHQELDEKKNAEEWMVDYALRQTVTKLGPARKKKVALLVEAFEKVMPITKHELDQSHSSAFGHARPVQACN